MSEKLIPFIAEVVGDVMPFGSLITYIHVKQSGDGIMAAASANDGSIHMSVVSTDDIDFGDSVACLSNLGFLNQAVNTTAMTDGAEVELGIIERGDKKLVTQITFRPNDRMEINYIATDPFRASILKPSNVSIKSWPIEFTITTESLNEIAAFSKIHAAAPTNGVEPRINLVYTDGNIFVEYGNSTSHTSAIELDVEVVADTNNPVSVGILPNDLLRVLRKALVGNDAVTVMMHEKAIRVVYNTGLSTHTITLIGRKQRTD